ncbi:MAG TPA: biotin/lipoyl-containing protein [Thermoanaerobaculia bacterium]|nr:biotin/lipoyl-containing protein [Thermoanaerobaculia bacterium]
MSDRMVVVDGDEVTLSLEKTGSSFRVESDGRTYEIELISIRDEVAELRIDGRRALIPFSRKGDVIQFIYEGDAFTAGIGESRSARKRGHELSMTAPMPGAVLKIFVTAGDVVTKGSPLLILEAMKMEHQISATYDGTVRAVHCRAGELVQPGVDLISIDPKEKP